MKHISEIIDPRRYAAPQVVGIDPSLTNTAVVIGDGVTCTLGEFGSKNAGDNIRSRVARYDALVAGVVEFIESPGPSVAIFIEGYSFGSNMPGKNGTVEFGGLLRWHLVDRAPRVYEVAPTTLKKFVTGKGNAKKEQMLAHVQKRWGEMFEANDAGDAFGLYKLGCVVERLTEADTDAQREAAAKVAGSLS